jgi:hypothetical protein
VALLKEFQESLTLQESRQKRRIVYPFFLLKDEDTGEVVVIFPAFPDLETRDGDEESAIARARDKIVKHVHKTEKEGSSLPLPNYGERPEDFYKRFTISIELADRP